MDSNAPTTSANVITSERLGSLFRPRGVALVGASDKSVFSRNTFDNLVDCGFADRVHLVNRRGEEVHGRPAVRTCAEIDGEVDVAYLMVPQSGMLDAMSDAAAAGIPNAVVLSAGYGEAGQAGRTAQTELVEHAERLGMALLGPNQLGFANLVDQIPVIALRGMPRHAGPVALLSQSGASSSAMVDFATTAGVGLSYVVTLGNEAMITAGHVLDFLIDDPHTEAVALFLEEVRQPDVFHRACLRAAAAHKAVVVLKAGRSDVSARTAAAHTGALVGNDRVVDAVFGSLGVIRVETIEDMLVTAGLIAHTGLIERPGVGVVSISGGACDILADRAQDVGLALPDLAASTVQALAAVMPTYGTVQNPLDVTGAAIIDPSLFTNAITAIADDPEVGVVAVINSLPWSSDDPDSMQPFVDAIGEGIARASTPAVYVNQVMLPLTDTTWRAMDHAGVRHAIPGLGAAATALRHLGWWSRAVRDLDLAGTQPEMVAVGDGADRVGPCSEPTARSLLSRAGIPVVPAHLVTSSDEAVAAAAELGGAVAVKVVSPNVLHKSDIGGVRLGVRGDGAVAQAYRDVTHAATAIGAPVEGALVSPMRTGGHELLVGVVRDPQWGLVMAVALGGIFVEVLQDSVLHPLPVNLSSARAMVEGLSGVEVLRGARGTTPVDLDALAAVIARVSDLALALVDDLDSLEINPLWVDGGTIEALDVLVIWRTGPPRRDEQSLAPQRMEQPHEHP